MANHALLVIDIQNDYFSGGRHPLEKPEAALSQSLREIDQALKKNEPVIIIQHIHAINGPFFRLGTLGAANHPLIEAVATKMGTIIYLTKSKRNSFVDTDLATILESRHIQTLTLCGMKSDWCITDTSLAALKKGYQVKVVKAACTSLSEDIHNQAIQNLAAHGVQIC
ncbi:cysteine hydrolase family protein [Listeria ilorinensis]|uniref:cysteine hydrolase family protein n=1 Tax=Listeria ilorinensis TaxID=2867439 RepID=UPI001EF4EE08|nr:isochorismatase family cysteine hydrolase [Listeria ilorinensis]